VECEADFFEMKKRFNADAVERIPEDFKKKCQKIRDRGDVLSISINGPFWQLREWCGFEGLCIMMIMQPEFVMEMACFWKSFVTRMLHRVLDEVVLDRVFISEDMAYKAHSMISKEMTRKFLVPCYNEWVGILKSAGVPVIEMDSDGCVDELIPIWIESKFDMCSPVEVAAHNDIVEYHRLYKKDMAYFGGVDKRCIAKGGMTIVDEMNRLAPVIKAGGYIPSCDHGVPFDISWQDFIRYSRILGELTGWL
jgi:uroporphyrinogen decarboxylase